MSSKILLVVIAIFCICIALPAQTQKGTNIEGESSSDGSGYSVSMADSNTVAIGAPGNDGNDSTNTGHVRVYTWDQSVWTQKGIDINGEAAHDMSGRSVSMPDPNTLAVGAPLNSESGDDAGHVRIFKWNGSSWTQKGMDLNGEAAGDFFGEPVSMPDSNTVAIGGTGNDGNGNNSGHVRIYKWNGNAWAQKGQDINGEAAGDHSGHSVSMPDPNTVAIGAVFNDDSADNAGHGRIFRWNGSTWIQKGNDIDGKAAGDNAGSSLSMPDSNTIAIGASGHDGIGNLVGHVRIFRWNGSGWTQKGSDIDGEAPGDGSGASVSMPDPNTVAIGATGNNAEGENAGHVRIFTWDSNAWTQKGSDIDGEAPGDHSGQSVSMPDPKTVAIGAHFNDGNGPVSGHVRIYTFNTATGMEQFEHHSLNLSIYPNPTDGILTIDEYGPNKYLQYAIKTITGRVILKGTLDTSSSTIDLSDQSAGIYFLELSKGGETMYSQKVITE